MHTTVHYRRIARQMQWPVNAVISDLNMQSIAFTGEKWLDGGLLPREMYYSSCPSKSGTFLFTNTDA